MIFNLKINKQIPTSIMDSDETIIAQTKKWITDVVIGCNFCPFAARELKADTIHYMVLENAGLKKVFFRKLIFSQQVPVSFIIT